MGGVIVAQTEIIKQETWDDVFFPVEIKDFYLVNQSNDLVNARQDLNITERRIIFSLISLVQPEDEEMKTYILSIKHLAELCGLEGNSFHQRVEKAVEELQRKKVVIEKYENGKRTFTDNINWIQQSTYLHQQGLIRIKLSDELAAHLVGLKTYTKYRLYNVLRLRSDYSWRMYELLKEKETFQRKRVLTIDELRKKLNIPDGKLEDTKNLKRVVLEKSKKELEEKTDIKFTYEVHKKVGRKIHSFIFHIEKNEKNIRKMQSSEAIKYDVQTLFNRLTFYGVNRKVITKIIDEYHPRYIDDNLSHVIKTKKEKGGIDNISGYIVDSLKNNWANSAYTVEDVLDTDEIAAANMEFYKAIEEETRRNLETLRDIYKTYNEMILDAARSGGEVAMQAKREERDQIYYRTFNEIFNYRTQKNIPHLTEADLDNEAALIEAFREWQESRGQSFGASTNPVYDIPVRDKHNAIDMPMDEEDEDLPF